jgi:hypothetical protein
LNVSKEFENAIVVAKYDLEKGQAGWSNKCLFISTRSNLLKWRIHFQICHSYGEKYRGGEAK